MKRSVLSYRQESAQAGAAVHFIALHGSDATCAQLIPLCRSLSASAGISAPEGPVPAPARFGTLGTERNWYMEHEDGSIEPAGFVDSLHQVEQFVMDTLDELDIRGPNRPDIYLVGLGQGGALALTLSLFWPETFRGVVAVQGYVPEIQGLATPRREMNELPVLLVRDPKEDQQEAAKIEGSASRLRSLGAPVTLQDIAGASALPPAVRESISSWMRAIPAKAQTPIARPPHAHSKGTEET